jgi:putative glycerol-1-phosphate prenyltransferase
MSILSRFNQTNLQQLALLIDPDKYDEQRFRLQIQAANRAKVDYIFLGGSLISNDGIGISIQLIKQLTDIPVAIFPGNGTHFHESTDAILFLSLISGRNPELLIGNHVHTAPLIKRKGVEAIPTGYILVESGRLTTAQYMSNTLPIPHDKADVAVATAIAGEMLGLKTIYLDAGSGADKPVSENMIRQVKANISLPLIVGGGIRDANTALLSANAGADIIVVGNAAEENPELLMDIAMKLHQY